MWFMRLDEGAVIPRENALNLGTSQSSIDAESLHKKYASTGIW